MIEEIILRRADDLLRVSRLLIRESRSTRRRDFECLEATEAIVAETQELIRKTDEIIAGYGSTRPHRSTQDPQEIPISQTDVP
jgi:hypothetical protein